MKQAYFEWDEEKNARNIAKHDVSFSLAQHAFLDPDRVIVEDATHSAKEKRLYCIGKVSDDIITVRFTYRGEFIRIYGAGYWRKGRNIYEAQNKVH